MVRALKSLLRKPWYGLVRGARTARALAGGLWFDIAVRTYRTSGQSFHIPRDLTSLKFRSRFVLGAHERDERRAVAQYLPRQSAVLELGGGLGVVSCLINSMLSDGRRHVVVEANPNLISVLTANRERNGCLFAIENGLVTSTEHASFYLAPSISHSSIYERAGPKLDIPKLSLASLEKSGNLHFDVLVSDIEGGELRFFEEHRAGLERFKVIIIQLHEKIIGREGCDYCRCAMADVGLRLVERFGSTEVWARGDLSTNPVS